MTVTVIDRFQADGEHTPLSNFHYTPMRILDVDWDTVEHFFQAMKTLDPERRELIRRASSPSQAKTLGNDRRLTVLRHNWEAIKIPVMRTGLRNKFMPSNTSGRYLLNTGNALLIEGNSWGDKYWGCVNGIGENWLGHLLMARRAEIRYLEATGSGGVAFVRIGR